jgi:integrase
MSAHLRDARTRIWCRLYWVSRQLGHADIGTTLKHYARFLPDVQQRNFGLLNAYFQVEHVSELGHPDQSP